jgi:hypothetical protein
MRKIAHVVSKMTLAEARLEPTNHSHSGMAAVQVLFIRLQNGLCSGTDRFDPLRIPPPTSTKPGTHLMGRGSDACESITRCRAHGQRVQLILIVGHDFPV